MITSAIEWYGSFHRESFCCGMPLQSTWLFQSALVHPREHSYPEHPGTMRTAPSWSFQMPPSSSSMLPCKTDLLALCLVPKKCAQHALWDSKYVCNRRLLFSILNVLNDAKLDREVQVLPLFLSVAGSFITSTTKYKEKRMPITTASCVAYTLHPHRQSHCRSCAQSGQAAKGRSLDPVRISHCWWQQWWPFDTDALVVKPSEFNSETRRRWRSRTGTEEAHAPRKARDEVRVLLVVRSS